jgi:hypothetical protein
LPATGWIRRYRVRAKGQTSQAILDGLRDGVTIEGVTYAGIEAKFDRLQGANCWLTMALREGKNREIKRVLESIGLRVNRLIRISFGPFQLGDLAEGKMEEVRTRAGGRFTATCSITSKPACLERSAVCAGAGGALLSIACRPVIASNDLCQAFAANESSDLWIRNSSIVFTKVPSCRSFGQVFSMRLRN